MKDLSCSKEQIVDGEENEEDEIRQSFFGRITQVLRYEEDGQHKIRSHKDKFSNILLNVQSERDVYAAWEKAHSDIIENYQSNSESKPVTAEKIDWIELLPEVLIIQLNRVKFEKNQMVKTTHKVPIPAEIYPDRFHIQNQEEVEKQRAKVAILRAKINYLDKCLAQFTSFGPRKAVLSEILDSTCFFLEQQNLQGLPQVSPNEQDALKGITPESPFTQATEPNVEMVKLMVQYRNSVQVQITSIESQISKYQLEISKAYSHLEKIKYTVHAICVHEGSAESGHYYTFIKDHNQGKWRNYNDIRVSEVDEATVFEHANGESGLKSAYWVVYINQKCFLDAQKSNLNDVQANFLYK